jgi:hypothetical protein
MFRSPIICVIERQLDIRNKHNAIADNPYSTYMKSRIERNDLDVSYQNLPD